MSDSSPPNPPKPPTALPPTAKDDASDAEAKEAEGKDESPAGEMAEAFAHMKKAAEKLVAKADPAMKKTQGAVDKTFEKIDPALKGVGEKVDAVIDKMDPAFDAAAAEAKRLASKVAKSAEPMTKQVQEGIGRFADRLGKWARGDSEAPKESTGEEE